MKYRGVNLRWIGLMENGYPELGEYYYITVTKDGLIYDARKGRLLTKHKHEFGYETVNIGKKTYLVHRLVAMLYVPRNEEEDTNIVCHINKKRNDNRAKNLIWVNNSHISMRRRHFKKDNKGKVIIGYTKDGRCHGVYENGNVASKKLGLNSSEIYRCCKGIRKSTGGYTFRYSPYPYGKTLEIVFKAKMQEQRID